ncbi:holo-[acyl-carrier-protein] synthase [Thermotoga sp. KOL6]|uniref:holo-[acyl-carrier-protein] synthase n=1 Tax=Thermotoga sp. KOL6 TaxID=126741 RepID=UPI000C77F199|nr:holo-[acyl-carrier-protein] synthase [Thermotoga sp. KOL6]PLV59393.1 4'-phosphopantetheinyl transferase [Thermotoga sp. KOL6]
MIVGVGVDLLEIERIHEKLVDRILGKGEKEIYRLRNRKKEFLAGRFALKEAFFKALGTGINGFRFADVEFLEDKGKPVLKIHRDFGLFNFAHISLSHDVFVIAVVVLEKRKGGIIVKGEEEKLSKNFEILGRKDDGWEIDSQLPPFVLKEILQKLGCKLVKYGNILVAGCEENEHR